MCCQGHWVTWRLESCRWNVELPQPRFHHPTSKKIASEKKAAKRCEPLSNIISFLVFGCIMHSFARPWKENSTRRIPSKRRSPWPQGSRHGFLGGFLSPVTETKRRGTTWWNAEPWAMTPWSQRGGWVFFELRCVSFVWIGCWFWGWFVDGWNLLEMGINFQKSEGRLVEEIPKGTWGTMRNLDHAVNVTWAPTKNSYFPLYWLIYRDPYNGLL